MSRLPLTLPSPDSPHIKHARHLYTVLVDKERTGISRNQFMQELHQRGIGTGVHFNPVHLHKYYREKYGYKIGDYPKAEYIGERTVSLPLSAKLTMSEARRIAQAVEEILTKSRAKKDKF